MLVLLFTEKRIADQSQVIARNGNDDLGHNHAVVQHQLAFVGSQGVLDDEGFVEPGVLEKGRIPIAGFVAVALGNLVEIDDSRC